MSLFIFPLSFSFLFINLTHTLSHNHNTMSHVHFFFSPYIYQPQLQQWRTKIVEERERQPGRGWGRGAPGQAEVRQLIGKRAETVLARAQACRPSQKSSAGTFTNQPKDFRIHCPRPFQQGTILRLSVVATATAFGDPRRARLRKTTSPLKITGENRRDRPSLGRQTLPKLPRNPLPPRRYIPSPPLSLTHLASCPPT